MKVFANLDKIKDSARELLKAWEIRGFCEIKESPDDHIWFEKVGKICLFDLTVFKNLNQRAKDAELVILGNKDLGEDLLPNMVHGIFWARHPIALENYIYSFGRRPLKTRKGLSCGIFGYENYIQYQRRTTFNWHNEIEKFSLSNDTKKYKQFEYLEILADHIFSLDLCGTGQRCNRIVESMALGAIPLLQDNYYTNFHNDLEPGKHYLSCPNNPTGMGSILESMKSNVCNGLQVISDNAIQFYQDNFSPEGSFNTIQEIISNNK